MDELIFDNRNPNTQRYLVAECMQLARAVASEEDPAVPDHFFDTLLGFDIMCRPDDDEVREIFANCKKIYQNEATAIQKAKRYFVLKFCYENF